MVLDDNTIPSLRHLLPVLFPTGNEKYRHRRNLDLNSCLLTMVLNHSDELLNPIFSHQGSSTNMFRDGRYLQCDKDPSSQIRISF